ncbi:MAG: DUF1552 domain-containing protein [Acidobacteria bacterium]|nr:DUF1552 domain-containing protein [Acidobacteriota bacterium]
MIPLKTRPLDRRTFLRGGGVALALPLLEAMQPRGRAAAAEKPPMRMVCVGNPLGMLPEAFFPAEAGADYTITPALEPLAAHRRDFTLFSHLDHDVTGGHRGVHAFLSGLRDQDASDWPERNISVDQRAAELIGARTRFPSITAGVGHADGDMACRMSWTRNGVNVPPVTKASELFRALFVAEDAEDRRRQAKAHAVNASILDAVRAQANAFHAELGTRDQQKLDEYLTSVREVERKIGMANGWVDQPKPEVELEPPQDGPFTQSLRVFFELLALALQTDSTRVATLEIPGVIDTQNLGLDGGYHGFSHHGKAEVLQRGLLVIEKFQTKELARFLGRLSAMQDADGARMLDRTMVLFGSGMGNGSSHSNKDLPILLAGGGFRHGEHKVYSEQRRAPLCNLYTTMLQRFGVETDKFNKASGTLADFS